MVAQHTIMSTYLPEQFVDNNNKLFALRAHKRLS